MTMMKLSTKRNSFTVLLFKAIQNLNGKEYLIRHCKKGTLQSAYPR